METPPGCRQHFGVTSVNGMSRRPWPALKIMAFIVQNLLKTGPHNVVVRTDFEIRWVILLDLAL
jgi:hypothetical protein